jgi:hypothetical protein
MAAAGAIFIARKILAPKAEQIFFAMFLLMIAAFYLAKTFARIERFKDVPLNRYITIEEGRGIRN